MLKDLKTHKMPTWENIMGDFWQEAIGNVVKEMFWGQVKWSWLGTSKIVVYGGKWCILGLGKVMKKRGELRSANMK